MANNPTVLVVEDEADEAEALCHNFARQGYLCRRVRQGQDALGKIASMPCDIVLLDRSVPGLSSGDLIGKLRRNPKTAATPIMMLAPKAAESDELVGLALEADDYVTKPFSMKVLLARVDALLRRVYARPDPPSDVHAAGPITLDKERREVRVDDAVVSLTSAQFRILWALTAAQGRVLSREQIIQQALGTHVAVTETKDQRSKKMNDEYHYRFVRGI